MPFSPILTRVSEGKQAEGKLLKDSLDGVVFRQILKSDKDFEATMTAWEGFMHDSWGSEYPLDPRVELDKIFDDAKPGFACGAFHRKGVLLAAQAVNWVADPESWRNDRMFFADTYTREDWRGRGIWQRLYRMRACWAAMQEGEILCPFEKLTLVRPLMSRGWVWPEKPKDSVYVGEGGQTGLKLTLPREALDAYLASDQDEGWFDHEHG